MTATSCSTSLEAPSDPQGLDIFTVYRGRVGLYLLLRAMGIGPGDEVATQAFTCLAVPEAIMASGALPRYIDIEPRGVNIDSKDLERKLNPRIRAIVVQHTFGVPARLDAILEIANARGLAVIEDCCHSHSSRYRGRLVGTFGVGAFHSYEWGKPVPLGVGGTVTVNDARLRAKVSDLYSGLHTPDILRAMKVSVQAFIFRRVFTPRRYWMLKDGFRVFSKLKLVEGSYNVVGPGRPAADFSLRMIPSVLAKYRRDAESLVDAFANHSRRLVTQYQREIRSPRAQHLDIPPNTDVVFVRYPLIVDHKARLLALARRGHIEVADWYATPVHPLPTREWSAVHYRAGSCPVAEDLATRFVSLPVHAKVTDDDVERTVELLDRL